MTSCLHPPIDPAACHAAGFVAGVLDDALGHDARVYVVRAAHSGRRAMTRPQVERFAQLFERVSRHALHTLPATAERTVEVDARRRPIGPPWA